MRRRFRKRKPGIGRTWLEPCRREINLTSHYALTSHSLHKKRILADSFLFHEWLGKIKQALTIYKEDIRQQLEDYDPESK